MSESAKGVMGAMLILCFFCSAEMWKCELIENIYEGYNIQNKSFHHFPFMLR
jgi:hypothetical protein